MYFVGEEYNLLPQLITSGEICGIDTVLIEYHIRNSYDLLQPKLHNVTQLSMKNLQNNMEMLLGLSSPRCNTRMRQMDDEFYHNDSISITPLPLFPNADPICSMNRNDIHCLLTKPPSGMSAEKHHRIILGNEIDDT